jgi:hypothetical protein
MWALALGAAVTAMAPVRMSPVAAPARDRRDVKNACMEKPFE